MKNLAKPLPMWLMSLGCPKNSVDTEKFLGSLGYQVKSVAKLGQAKVAFINTCAFIEPASRESLAAIFDVAKQIKKLKSRPLLVVAGCLPGRYGVDELAKEIPEVDLWLTSKSITDWPKKLNEALAIDAAANSQGRLESERSYAWLKISEGCQHKCAFCAIPAIRGPLQSTPALELFKEGQELVRQGAKELVLVGQDVSAWGADFKHKNVTGEPQNLVGLVRLLRKIPGLRWLRLMYLYPSGISDELLDTIAEGAPVLPYLDIPFQHCQKKILEAMGRPFAQDPARIIEKIRAVLPDAALRTTLITGYPGETEADFEALCQFVTEARFQNLGVFPFMAEEGVKAALLPDQIPVSIREERASEIMRIQADISRELLSELPGQRMEVLVDKSCAEEWPGLYAGRVWFQAPEVDGITYISGPGVQTGELIEADIEDSQIYDLSALA